MMRAFSCCSLACLRISVICSTAVVTNSVSPPDALIFASCAEKSVAFRVHRFHRPDLHALPLQHFGEFLGRAEAEVVVGRTGNPPFDAHCLAIAAKARASISDVGLIRKIHGLPEVVIFPDDEVSTSIGTPYP